jgi:hypothetical protein
MHVFGGNWGKVHYNALFEVEILGGEIRRNWGVE